MKGDGCATMSHLYAAHLNLNCLRTFAVATATPSRRAMCSLPARRYLLLHCDLLLPAYETARGDLYTPTSYCMTAVWASSERLNIEHMLNEAPDLQAVSRVTRQHQIMNLWPFFVDDLEGGTPEAATVGQERASRSVPIVSRDGAISLRPHVC
eukprot:1905572-Pleurochrysis_carterae.AAC.2